MYADAGELPNLLNPVPYSHRADDMKIGTQLSNCKARYGKVRPLDEPEMIVRADVLEFESQLTYTVPHLSRVYARICVCVSL